MRKTNLPINAAGLRAIGIVGGKPVWPVMGGSTPEPPAPVEPTAPATPATPPSAPATDALGEPGKAALVAERKRASDAEKLNKELEARLKTIEDKDKSELEKAQQRIAELEKEHGHERTERLRLAAASKHSIPAEYLDLLTGTDEAALEVQAVRLAELVKAPKVPAFVPNPGQGTPPVASTEASVAAGAALYRQQHQKT